MLLKNIILKIRQVFLSFFEDRKSFWIIFDTKLTSSRKGPFCTLAKCFVLYHFGDESGFYALLTLFSLFLSFSSFFTFYVVGKIVSLACVKRTTFKNRCSRQFFSFCPSSSNYNCNGRVPSRNVHFFLRKSDICRIASIRLDPIFDFFSLVLPVSFLQSLRKKCPWLK